MHLGALMSRPRYLVQPLVLAVMLALVACSAESPESGTTQQQATVTGESPLVGAFVRASIDTGVPAELLASLAYVETRFSQSVGYDSDLAHGAVTGWRSPSGVSCIRNGSSDTSRSAGSPSSSSSSGSTSATGVSG